MVLRINKDTPITPQIIKKLVDRHLTQDLPRLQRLERYYLGKNDILNRRLEDPTKPNNKICNPFASYITDTLVGYFIGEPISYACENTALLEKLNEIFEYTDEADENTELAKNASIYGQAFELVYMDEDSQLRFSCLDPKSCIPIYDDTVNQDLIGFIRFWETVDLTTEKKITTLEYYDANSVTTYQSATEGATQFIPIDTKQHFFGMVPVAIYRNNVELLGDFERVISLIDAYDKMESDSLNDFEYFVDAYLALYGFTADAEDVRRMKENRVLLMDEGTKAEWLIKQENDSHTENQKNRLDADIHKFAKCPNLSDKEFASNASGVAIKFKLLGTENLVSIKERKFKRGLQMRLELISKIQGLLDGDFDWRDIDIVFTRNIPSNDTDLADMVTKLDGIVSKETLLAQIPWVEDVQQELKNLENEDAASERKRSSLDYLTAAMANRIGKPAEKEDEVSE